MNEQQVTKICKTIIDPLTKFVDIISKSIENLASKDDIGKLIVTLEKRFQKDILEHDNKITDLENDISTICNACRKRNDDLSLRIEKLEENIRPSDETALTEISSIAALSEDLNKRIFNLEEAIRSQEETANKETRSTWSNPSIDSLSPSWCDTSVNTTTRDTDTSAKEYLDLVVCGDSIVKYLDVDQINPDKPNKLVCLPGGRIHDIRNAVVDLAKTHSVNHLVLHVATNNTPSESPKEVIEKMHRLIKEIKTNMPSTSLYISAVLPKTCSNWLPGINQINLGLCRSQIAMNYVFIQHPRFASQGRINENLFSGDAIHLNRRGVAQLAIDIKYNEIFCKRGA